MSTSTLPVSVVNFIIGPLSEKDAKITELDAKIERLEAEVSRSGKHFNQIRDYFRCGEDDNRMDVCDVCDEFSYLVCNNELDSLYLCKECFEQKLDDGDFIECLGEELAEVRRRC